MPEFLYATSHLAGDFPNPGNAVGDTPTTWAGELNANSNYTSRWAMGDPSDDLEGTQTIRIVARKGSNSGTPTIQVNLYENGSLVESLVATTNITSTTGQTLTGTFAASSITNAADVEIEVVQTGAGGNPSTRNAAQISHIEFEAEVVSTDPNATLEGTLGNATADGLDASVVGGPLPPEFEMWPISDAAVGTWTVFSLGFEESQHWDHLNTEDDLSGIETVGSISTYRANLDTPPDTPSGATVHIRASADFEFGDLTVGLFEDGSSVWTSDPFNPVFDLATYDIAVPQGVVDGITDWSKVSLAVTAVDGDEVYTVTWMRLTANVATSGDVTLEATLGGAEATGLDAEVTAQASATLEATVGEATAEGLDADVTGATSVTLEATVGEATAEGLDADVAGTVSVTLEATVGEATADGLDAEVATTGSATLEATVGEATADGLDANVSTSGAVTLEATLGEATATGLEAQVATGTAAGLEATVGEATATGLEADVSTTSTAALEATLGQADATGLDADVTATSSTTLEATLGGAEATGLDADVTATTASGAALEATVGEAVAEGLDADVTATSSASLEATVGEATATGLDADVTAGANVTLEATVGEAVADGLDAEVESGTNATLEATVGEAVATGLAAEVSVTRNPVITATLGTATATGLTAAATGAVTVVIEWVTQERAGPADWLEVVGPSAPLTTESGEPITTETDTPISVLVTFSWGDQEPVAPPSWTTQERA